ncbi:MAG: T9SS type A sorting domain-containing protein, partial [Bacteroidetes bacterium]|nr:T9SS type A sorting domain-containing protein [Bacteroidota bacterium]
VVYDCPDLQANIGDSCNDNDSTTVDDVITDGCICAGTGTVGIEEGRVDGTMRFELTPNPTVTGQTRLHMEGLGQVQAVVVTVRDAAGRIVGRSTVNCWNGRVDQWIQLPGNLAKGLYMVQADARSARFIQRLVVR